MVGEERERVGNSPISPLLSSLAFALGRETESGRGGEGKGGGGRV